MWDLIVVAALLVQEQEGLLKVFREEFVAITPGRNGFPADCLVGSESGGASERPVHRVTFKRDFHVARHEVPQNLWEAVMGNNPSKWKGKRNSVEVVSFDEAVDFCAKATVLMRAAGLIEAGQFIRLPSEAEWEYVARAGTTTRYSFGDDPGELDAYGWHTGNAAGNDPPVGAKKPNAWKLHDVHGYLWEWCADVWHDTYEGAPEDGTAWTVGGDPERRVLRGGSWKDKAGLLTSSYRRPEPAGRRDDAVGLRCVLDTTSDWPQLRGPDGQGHADVKQAPLIWGDATWKVPIDGLGWSSPVIAGERVWLTTATEGGKSLRAVCLDAKTGRSIHDVEMFHLDKARSVHKKNSHASPTPILDGDRVYVHFGSQGTAALSSDGKVLWRQTVPYDPVHGSGGSPVLHGELLIFSCDGSAAPFVIALDRASGAIRWKTPRETNAYAKKFAFSTPLVITVKNVPQVVSPGAGGVTSYDPATGRPLWHVKYDEGYSVIPRPVYGHGLVFLSSGFDRPALLAIRPDDATVAWRLDRGAPLTPSPLLVGDELYLVSDQGIATCLDARSGKVHWQERLGGNFSASPLYAAGRIYFLSEDGVTTVLKPDKAFTRLAKNEIKGRTYASLAAIEGALFLRTDTHLMRIEAK